LINIGMPVYNGAEFLHRAVDSLLSQTEGNFELLISDNASTDDTEAICREYLKRDPRVRYVRHERNRGVTRRCE
jgi:glycosyltransferase involved in cell wall biosynthesis